MRADEPLYTMSVAARLTGMHPQTLRKYERAGLITPARPSGNQRLYSEADIVRLRRIQHLVEERGVNIAGLELALAMSDRLDSIHSESTSQQMRAGIDEARGMGNIASRAAAATGTDPQPLLRAYLHSQGRQLTRPREVRTDGG